MQGQFFLSVASLTQDIFSFQWHHWLKEIFSFQRHHIPRDMFSPHCSVTQTSILFHCMSQSVETFWCALLLASSPSPPNRGLRCPIGGGCGVVEFPILTHGTGWPCPNTALLMHGVLDKLRYWLLTPLVACQALLPRRSPNPSVGHKVSGEPAVEFGVPGLWTNNLFGWRKLLFICFSKETSCLLLSNWLSVIPELPQITLDSFVWKKQIPLTVVVKVGFHPKKTKIPEKF